MRRLLPLVLFGALTFGADAPALADSGGGGRGGDPMERFAAALEKVRRSHVDEISTEKLVEAAIDGMMASLDPHSKYLTPDEYRRMRQQTSGSFGGIGVRVRMETVGADVVAVLPGMPAERGGLAIGDVISHVDGRPVAGLEMRDLSGLMRGEIGSELVLTVVRDGRPPFELRLTRALVEEEIVSHQVRGRVGVIKLRRFTRNAAVEVERAVGAVERDLGGPADGYVLDLRDNPGGLVSQAVAIADLFLEEGVIVTTRARQEGRSSVRVAQKGDRTRGAPVVVLVDGGSASASEIVAGALQDHGRATVVGSTTYGKGSVQTIKGLPGGGATKLTTARYYTPSGRSIQGTGVKPDVEVSDAAAMPAKAPADPAAAAVPPDVALERAVEIVRGVRRVAGSSLES